MPSIDDASVAVALGANRPSVVGPPRETLLAVRPLLEELLAGWAAQDLRFCWSQLLETKPIGPIEQPDFVNAVVLVKGLTVVPSERLALDLLQRLHGLERRFGRERSQEQRWGPRSLDLDLLFWGELRLDHPQLILPHPRMHLRAFVLEPLLQAMQGIHPPCW